MFTVHLSARALLSLVVAGVAGCSAGEIDRPGVVVDGRVTEGGAAPDGGATDATVVGDALVGPCLVGQRRSCYPGPAGTFGVGRCSAGTQACVAERWGRCAEARVPITETCDGLDEDCDGTTDEGLDGGDCEAELGACTLTGTVACVDGVVRCFIDAAQGGVEVCNGRDDDCDGRTDEVNGAPCSVGLGGCAVEGVEVCVDGEMACDAVAGLPGDEGCDGRDDDCDGFIDEGLGGTACEAGTGACRAEGTIECVDGALGCTAEGSGPSDETCDGVDQDCDGIIDEAPTECSVPNGISACLAGACALGRCAPGFRDRDRNLENGCELGCGLGAFVELGVGALSPPGVAVAPDGSVGAVWKSPAGLEMAVLDGEVRRHTIDTPVRWRPAIAFADGRWAIVAAAPDALSVYWASPDLEAVVADDAGPGSLGAPGVSTRADGALALVHGVVVGGRPNSRVQLRRRGRVLNSIDAPTEAFNPRVRPVINAVEAQVHAGWVSAEDVFTVGVFDTAANRLVESFPQQRLSPPVSLVSWVSLGGARAGTFIDEGPAGLVRSEFQRGFRVRTSPTNGVRTGLGLRMFGGEGAATIDAFGRLELRFAGPRALLDRPSEPVLVRGEGLVHLDAAIEGDRLAVVTVDDVGTVRLTEGRCQER